LGGAAAGLSPVVRGCRGLAQRACGGSQGRLRAARAIPRHPCGQPGSIPAAGGTMKFWVQKSKQRHARKGLFQQGFQDLSVFKRLLNVYQTDNFLFRFKFVLGVGGCPPRELWQ